MRQTGNCVTTIALNRPRTTKKNTGNVRLITESGYERAVLGGKILRVLDFETDPFKADRIPEPFTIGIFDGELYEDHWGRDAPEWFIDYLAGCPRSIWFAHNGGNFDFMFLREWWTGEPRIINGRLVEVEILGHTFRDSFKLLPTKLSELQAGKKEIDMKKLERHCREKHRDEILYYQMHDCLSLYRALREFIAEFGLSMTIGSAAIRELQSMYSYTRITPAMDSMLRPYFHGGRNQCFETGIQSGAWKVFDVNSMYPHVMATFRHPISEPGYFHNRVTKRTAFLTVEGKNDGALAVRTDAGGLDFTRERGEFHCSVHEFEAALETGTFHPTRIVETIEFAQWSTFENFVDKFYQKRLTAKANGEAMKVVFYKLLLNNAYGKFATDPENFRDYMIADYLPDPFCDGNCPEDACPHWQLEGHIEGQFHLFKRKSEIKSWQYFNVATGASITGAARAQLLRGLSKAVRPAYCDTDSIICEGLDGDLNENTLGAWKLEASGELLAVAGKKTYCLLSTTKPEAKPGKKIESARHEGRTWYSVKKASKGAILSPAEILAVANGDVVFWKNDAPKFKLHGGVDFVKRRIRRTA